MEFLKRVGAKEPFFLLSGPCVIESEKVVMEIAETMKTITNKLGIPYVFKASFDKANRTSIHGFRGLGREEGLNILAKVKADFELPIVTDVHAAEGMDEIAEVADVLQIPAFLCRQTDILLAAAKTGRFMNIKKGQFLSPWDMQHVVKKVTDSGHDKIMLCERGCSFGYQNLVVDMRSLSVMRDLGFPVVFDATHSVQLPGKGDGKTLGQREFVPVLSRAAAAVGVDGFFMETHPRPDEAMSDGPNAWPLDLMEPLLVSLLRIHNAAKEAGSVEELLEG